MQEKCELKPCPFCGGIDIRIREIDKYSKELYCSECGASVRGWNTGILINKWNRRREPDEDEVLIHSAASIAITAGAGILIMCILPYMPVFLEQ